METELGTVLREAINEMFSLRTTFTSMHIELCDPEYLAESRAGQRELKKGVGASILDRLSIVMLL